MSSTSERPAPAGDRLLIWLRLLGWDVRLRRDGQRHVARARRVFPTGEVEVVASERSYAAAVVTLFEAALESGSMLTRESRRPAAA